MGFRATLNFGVVDEYSFCVLLHFQRVDGLDFNCKLLDLWRVYMVGGCPANRANVLSVSLENALRRLHARQGARLPGSSCLLSRGTPLGRIAFYHVNGPYRAIPTSRDEINHEDMAARGEFFRSFHLPMLSAEQNDNQSEEINVIDESQAENRPVPLQETEIRWKKGSFVGRCVCCA